jgi:hypothetical protein
MIILHPKGKENAYETYPSVTTKGRTAACAWTREIYKEREGPYSVYVTHTKYIPCTRYRLSTILSKTVILDPLVPMHHSCVIYSFLHNQYLENQPYSCYLKQVYITS